MQGQILLPVWGSLSSNPPYAAFLFLSAAQAYNEAMHAQTSQTAACNGRHDLEPRLAKWLLMAHDRSDGNELSITQEFLSLMLCVYRPSVTVVAGILQRAGMIRYSKGSITILDRDALEATACVCYKTVQDRFEYLLG
jgi:CRP-like cAMP-binding protein